jgi:hypothetical protein
MTIKKLIALIFITTAFLGCSSNENSIETEEEINNKIEFEGNFYSLESSWIYDQNKNPNNTENYVSFYLFNKNLTEVDNGVEFSDFSMIFFNFRAPELKETTYENLIDFNIRVNGNLTNGPLADGNANYTSGIELLSHNDPNSDIYISNSKLTISELTNNTITLNFLITRKDGKTISGNYSGEFKSLN